jgi:hypothetical protein
MIVDGAGGTTGDRADRGARPASGYGSDGRATRSPNRHTPDSPANVMMTTVDRTVGAMRLRVRCVGRGDRDKGCKGK